MLALRFDGSPKVVEADRPTRGDGEALLRVRRAGICSTDLEIIKGYMGFSGTLGHEMVAEVVEHSDWDQIGKRVVAEINLACGRCERCLAGLQRHCAHRSVLGILNKDGCFAEYLTMPEQNLHVVPDRVSDDHAVFVEPLAAAFEILEQVRIEPNSRVAVLGDGKLGTLCALVLEHTGAEITVVGRHRRRMAALERRGMHTFLDQETIASGFDTVVEATGSPSGLARARALLRPRGTLVLKSTFFGETSLELAPFVIDEITMVGSRCGPYAPAIRALANGTIDPSPLIEETFPLAGGVDALAKASERGVGKVLLQPGT